MQKRIISFTVFLFLSVSIFGQNVILPMLGLKDKSVELTLTEVSSYISNKPKGLYYPVSKVMFKQAEEGGLTYEVLGIDNSWSNLFNYAEVSYGYAIVRNRLFVIMGKANEVIDLNTIFYCEDEGSKQFSRAHKPPTGLARTPKWTFEYIAGEAKQIKVEDLDILDK